MQRRATISVLAAALVLCSGSLALPSRAADTTADNLFAAGDFDAAAAAYAALLEDDPGDERAAQRLGTIDLYENDLSAAEDLLQQAKLLAPTDTAIAGLLAEIDRRQAESAKRVDVPGGQAIVPFLLADPLPLVRVQVDATHAAVFLVDTGSPDIVLDRDFANEIGVAIHDGSSASVRKLSLGGATAYDVTASVMPFRAIGASIFHRQVDGVLGTGLFERFLATLDYPNARLILRPRSADRSGAFEDAARKAGASIVPCWLYGSHYLFARAQVGDAAPGLFLFDSGLAGSGILASPALVQVAHLALDSASAKTSLGAAGAVTGIPFVAARVTVGNLTQTGVAGLYTPQGYPLAQLPFATQGSISHAFLERYAYTVDFDAMKLVLAPTLSAPAAAPRSKDSAPHP